MRAAKVDEMAAVLADKLQLQKLFVLHGKNTDSGLETTTTSTFEGVENFEVDSQALHPVLVESRVIKTEKELELLRFVNKLSSRAHINVMKNIRPGKMEFHAESDFLHYVYSNGGARFHAYTCICGSGHNASALHYGHAGAPNDKLLEDGDLFLDAHELTQLISDCARCIARRRTMTVNVVVVWSAPLWPNKLSRRSICRGTQMQ
jgi:Xaa-Pro dipeptidase